MGGRSPGCAPLGDDTTHAMNSFKILEKNDNSFRSGKSLLHLVTCYKINV